MLQQALPKAVQQYSREKLLENDRQLSRSRVRSLASSGTHRHKSCRHEFPAPQEAQTHHHDQDRTDACRGRRIIVVSLSLRVFETESSSEGILRLTDDEVHIPRIRALPPHTVRQQCARAASREQRRHRLLRHEAHDAAERDQGRSGELPEEVGKTPSVSMHRAVGTRRDE